MIPNSPTSMASINPTIHSGTTNENQQKQDQAQRHHRHRLRWWIGCCISFLIIAPVVSIMIGLSLHTRDFQYIPDANSVALFSGRTLQMELVLISADPLNGFMTMDWTILGESQSQCSANNLRACTDVNVFFDKYENIDSLRVVYLLTVSHIFSNLLSGDGSFEFRTSDRPSQPIFRFNASIHALKDIVGNTPTFRTDLALFSPGNRHSSLIYYPFDA